MFEILVSVIFIWLMIKVLGVVFKITWGLAKIAAFILLFLAAPGLILCLAFAGGLLLLVPLALIVAAFILVKVLT